LDNGARPFSDRKSYVNDTQLAKTTLFASRSTERRAPILRQSPQAIAAN
jgi:hypothetical protein